MAELYFTQQEYYTSLVALRNAAISRQSLESARLVDLQNEVATKENARAAALQGQMSAEKNSETWTYFQGQLDDLSGELTTLNGKVTEQKALLADIQEDLDSHNANIAAVNTALKLTGYFTSDELDILDPYFKQGSISDPTFAVFDVDASSGGSFSTSATASVSMSNVTWTDVPCDGDHAMATISGGNIAISGTGYALSAHIISGTADHSNGNLVCSLCVGNGTLNGVAFPSGNLTIVGGASYADDDLLSDMTPHTDTLTSDDGTVSHTSHFYTGDVAISLSDGAFYFTQNVTEYQRYSVEQELYDSACRRLEDLSSPTYEFEIKSGNIIFAEEFKAFKDALQLGSRCYLQIHPDLLLTPILIEIHLDFEDPTKFSLIFANQFKRPNHVNSMSDIIKDAQATTASYNQGRFTFAENNNTTTWVNKMIQDGFDLAKSKIKSGTDNFVTIDKAGIKINGDGVDEIILNNGMIALLDKRTNTVNLAMGHFLNEANGEDYVGILANVIGGTLIAGQNLIIECPDANGGIMQFKVDSSGVFLNNSRMYLQSEHGRIGIDPNYGIFGGSPELYTLNGTGSVLPSFIDPETGDVIFDDNGFPKNTNFWLGINGEAYYRGNMYAKNIYAESGTFMGTIKAPILDGELVGGENGGSIKGVSLDIGDGNYVVDNGGNATMNGDINLNGNINLSGASSINWGNNHPTSGISSSQCKTIINSQLVSSPNIAGGKFWDRDQTTWIEIAPKDENGFARWGMVLKSGMYNGAPIFGVYNGDFGYTSFDAKGYCFLTANATGDTTTPRGTWDFTDANVKGMHLTFS